MGRVRFFFCCVLCCTTAVPGTMSCCSTGWHRRRSPAVVRPTSLVRRRRRRAAFGCPHRSLTRCRSIARRLFYHHYYHVPILQHQRCTYAYYIDRLTRNTCTPSSSAQAQQCIAALPYGAVLCRAVLSFEHTAAPGTMRSIRYQVYRYERTYVLCTRLFASFMIAISSSRSPSAYPPPRILHPYSRSERDNANKHTAQLGLGLAKF